MYAPDSSEGGQESDDRSPKYKHLNRIPDPETPNDGRDKSEDESINSLRNMNLQRFRYTPKTYDHGASESLHIQSTVKGSPDEDVSVSSLTSVWNEDGHESLNADVQNINGSSAWTSDLQFPSTVPDTSNLFPQEMDLESDPFVGHDSFISDRGESSKAMFHIDTPNIFDAHSNADGMIRKRIEKSVTFNNEDIFNIYDENINSTFDLVGPPSQSQLIHGSQVRQLEGSSQLAPAERKISSSQCIKKPAESIFKLPDIPSNNIRSRTGSGSLNPLRSHSHLDPELTSKLHSFTEKLKSLTDPGTPLASEKMTPRQGQGSGMVTPRNKTPDSGARHGSVSSRGDTNMPDPSCFAAVYEGTGSAAGEVGVAAMYLDNPRLIICQFSDTKTYPSTMTKLLGINPSVILLPDTFGKSVKLYDDIATKFAGAAIQRVHRRHYSESKGLHLLRHLICPDFSSVEMQFYNKYFCLAAANSLLKVLPCHFFKTSHFRIVILNSPIRLSLHF